MSSNVVGTSSSAGSSANTTESTNATTGNQPLTVGAISSNHSPSSTATPLISGGSVSSTSSSTLSPFVRKCPNVAAELVAGDRLLKWEEENGLISQILMRLDANGFFIQWTDQNGDSDLLDMSLVRDARTGRYARQPRDARQRDMLHFGSQDTQLEDKLLTIVYGTDFANVNYLNFACPSRPSSQVILLVFIFPVHSI
jgi:hypothetical protein